jgi:hypothetical protein
MSSAKQNWITGSYWIAVALTLSCFAVVLARNTELVWRFEHTSFPLSWALGIAATLAFLATELCHSAFFVPRETENETSQLTPEWETAEF